MFNIINYCLVCVKGVYNYSTGVYMASSCELYEVLELTEDLELV